MVVSIDEVLERKIKGLDAHTSQVYEWLPWVAGQQEHVPTDPAARLEWLRKMRSGEPLSEPFKEALRKWYGARSESIRNVEAFEVCEYGRQPSKDDLKRLFPFYD